MFSCAFENHLSINLAGEISSEEISPAGTSIFQFWDCQLVSDCLGEPQAFYIHLHLLPPVNLWNALLLVKFWQIFHAQLPKDSPHFAIFLLFYCGNSTSPLL